MIASTGDGRARGQFNGEANTIAVMSLRKRVVVYVERDDGLLVFDHRAHPEAGAQVPAGGVPPAEIKNLLRK
jgi:hypothetical protein